MKYLPIYFASIISFFLLCLLSSCGNGSDLPSEQLVLKSLNETVKPPLEYTDLKKLDEKNGNDNGKDVYWIRCNTKLIASEDMQVFTKRGWTGMDTFYVASADTSMLNKIHSEITATNNYNKQFGAFNKSYEEVKTYKKGDIIKEEIRGLNFSKTDKGWTVMK